MCGDLHCRFDLLAHPRLLLAHQRLFNQEPRVLHHDISNNNILTGPEDAPDGMRGTFIDLDHAILIAHDIPIVLINHEIVGRVGITSLSLTEHDKTT